MDKKYLLLSLDDSRMKNIAEILGNKTSNKIIDFLKDPYKRSLLLFGISLVALIFLLLVSCKNFVILILIYASLLLSMFSGVNLLFYTNLFKRLVKTDEDNNNGFFICEIDKELKMKSEKKVFLVY